ncbi:MAG: glycosyltransferase family 4 protein [Flavobacterium sp.]
MKPLRILYVVSSFPSVTETFIATQVSSVKNLGYDCTIFSYQRSRDQVNHKILTDYQLEKSVVYHFKNEATFIKRVMGAFRFFINYFFQIRFFELLSLFNPMKLNSSRKKVQAYWDMPIFLLKKEFDIIHCHFGFNAIKLTRALRAGIVTRSKFIVTFHGSDLTPSKIEYYKDIYKDMFSCFDAFTVNTPYLRDVLMQVQPDLQPVYVHSVGFDQHYLQPFLDMKKDGSLFQMLYCGRLMKLKGPDIAIRILHLLYQKGYHNIRLLMIGEGEMKNELLQLSQELGVSDAINWAGALSQEDVFYNMGISDVFLYTGRVEEITDRAETQGLVIQEAQFLKLPVIVADVGGVKYGLQEGISGYLVPPEDIHQFCSHIESFYFNEQLKIQFGQAGHDFSKNKYTTSSLVRDLMSLYLHPDH